MTASNNYLRIAAQSIMPSLVPRRFAKDSHYRDQIYKLIDDGILGFCVFQGTLERTVALLSDLQSRAGGRLFFSADFEHGLPMRLEEGGTAFPHAMAMGATADTLMTNRVATLIALEMRALGVHWNFAPVCDVNSNRNNPIINIRSFGENKEIVSKHSIEYIKGLQNHGILACAKHFPGHGDTATDSHISMPILQKSLQELEQLELSPFVQAINNSVASIMIGHLAVPSIDESNVPASLSKPIVTDLLRKSLGYNGIIVTDALDMKAIKDSYSSAEATIRCLSAGGSIALIPDDPLEAVEGLAKEIETNEALMQHILSQQELVASIRKQYTISLPSDGEPINQDANAIYALEVAKKACTIVGNSSLLPITQYKHIAGLGVLQDGDIDQGATFFRYLSQVTEQDSTFGFIDDTITDSEVVSLKESMEECDALIVAIFIRAKSYKGTVGLPQNLLNAIQQLRQGKPLIVLLFGNPYLVELLNGDVTMILYSDTISALGAGAVKLCEDA
jgi:beta-N-acetylhexosaminidase